MYELAVAFNGSEDVSYQATEALLEDSLPANALIILPSYMSTGNYGLRTVKEWADHSGRTVERRRRDDMLQYLAGLDAEEKYVIVLGTEGLDDYIAEAQEESLPVLDLCRGLFAVEGPQGSVSDSESVSASSPTPGRVAGIVSAESFTEPTAILIKRVEILEKEVAELRAHVGVNESFGTPEVVVQPSDQVNEEVRTKYYKDAAGKLRKAGRSRARNGEEELWLTDDEYNSFPD